MTFEANQKAVTLSFISSKQNDQANCMNVNGSGGYKSRLVTSNA